MTPAEMRGKALVACLRVGKILLKLTPICKTAVVEIYRVFPKDSRRPPHLGFTYL